MARKRSASRGGATPSMNPAGDAPSRAASAAMSSVPAAMDFVHRYAETFHPHGCGMCGTS
jgi:hypothetical protein